jgi:hypothetical protein
MCFKFKRCRFCLNRVYLFYKIKVYNNEEYILHHNCVKPFEIVNEFEHISKTQNALSRPVQYP